MRDCSGCVLHKGSLHGVNETSNLALTLLAQLCALVQGCCQPGGGATCSKSDRGAARLAGLREQDLCTGDGLEPGPRMGLSDREGESRHSAKGGHAKGRCWGWI